MSSDVASLPNDPVSRSAPTLPSEPDVTGTSVEPTSAELHARLAAGDLAARDALLVAHLPLVKLLAAQMGRRLGARADISDLVSAGTIGLIHAIDSYDPSRGFAFSSFAAPRIRGAMLDDRRRSDHVSRGVRRRVRDLAAATAQLTQRLGRAPAERELASHLGVSVETLWRWREATEAATTCPAEEPRSRGAAAGGALAPSDLAQLATPETDAPDAALEREERAATLRAAIQRLAEQDRAVLGMYYFEEIPMREIGRVLSLTESRISQIHKRALRHLRAAMTEPSTPALAPAA